MSEKEYAKSIIDIIPDEYMDEVISFLLSLPEGNNDDKKFDLVSKNILEKYDIHDSVDMIKYYEKIMIISKAFLLVVIE